jgi:hypothetical protein
LDNQSNYYTFVTLGVPLMSVCALNRDAISLSNPLTLGMITHSTLQDDPSDIYPDLEELFPSISTFEMDAHWGHGIVQQGSSGIGFPWN